MSQGRVGGGLASCRGGRGCPVATIRTWEARGDAEGLRSLLPFFLPTPRAAAAACSEEHVKFLRNLKLINFSVDSSYLQCATGLAAHEIWWVVALLPAIHVLGCFWD